MGFLKNDDIGEHIVDVFGDTVEYTIAEDDEEVSVVLALNPDAVVEGWDSDGQRFIRETPFALIHPPTAGFWPSKGDSFVVDGDKWIVQSSERRGLGLVKAYVLRDDAYAEEDITFASNGIISDDAW
jgi:hypothetical protein